jgi:hypothetical protein
MSTIFSQANLLLASGAKVTPLRSPGTVANMTYSGTEPWSGLTNLTSINGAYASCALAYQEVGQPLRAYNFGFASDLPGNAIIAGIELFIAAQDNTFNDSVFKTVAAVFHTTGVIGDQRGTSGTVKRSQVVDLGTIATPASHRLLRVGGQSDDWGLILSEGNTTVRNAMIGGTFGFEIGISDATTGNGPYTRSIDALLARIYYN